MLNVGMDITSVIYGRGVSRYTSNLVTELVKRSDVHMHLYGASLRQTGTLHKFIDALHKQHLTRTPKFSSYIQQTPPTLQDVMWNTLKRNPVKKFFPKIDVFHSWDWLQPPDKDLPLVSTIHDLAILKFPETVHPKILKLHQQSWKVLKERNAEIIAVSHATKKDVVELLGFSPSKVHVIYEALPQETVRVADSMSDEREESIKRRLSLNKPYIFFVGTREPRKNLMKLIQAWQPLAKDVDLLIAGEQGWDETGKEMKGPQPRFLGRVSDEELVVLYEEAELFAFPSIYEGFGLPILEAFYHGTPVVTSNISSMPEVAGNAAELVDPKSVESIRKGLTTVLNESKEASQKRMQRMILRLQLFNWNKVADETIGVYRRAVEE